MSKKRVHELAKDLGLDNREAVVALQAAGVAVKTHSSSVYEEEARAVLNKIKAPEPIVPPRRPGMMIVKKKRDVEVSATAALTPGEDVSAAGADAAAVSADAAAAYQADGAPTPTAHHVDPGAPGDASSEQHGSAAIAAQAGPAGANLGHDGAGQAGGAQANQAAPRAGQVHAAQASSDQTTQGQADFGSAGPEPKGSEGHAPAADGTASGVPSAAPPPSAGEAVQRAPSMGSGTAGTLPGTAPPRPTLQPRQEYTPPKRGEFGRRPDVRGRDGAGPPPGAPPRHAGSPPGGLPADRPGVRPGAATVVRMIDRDKLLERVPGRRLGSDRGGPGGQRFGQVTELRVVNDPFGRGREMVTVGRDKRKGPAAGATAAPGRAGAGPGGARGRGRPGGRRDHNDMRERSGYPSRLKKKKTNKRAAKKVEATQPKASKRVIKMKESIVVADLAHELGAKSVDIVRRLMAMGSMVTQNQRVDFDTATLIAADFEFTVESVAFEEARVIAAPSAPDDEGRMARPPVVTVMGHVDHGKTSLLDAIRKKRVAQGEAGGITQHIGAYSVPVENRGSVTFLDTPGHAAFTSMRARGAKVTDIVVLVVAADDGVMPQTEEAIEHARAAGVPIVVAVNKIDKPEANPDRVMQELTKFELLPESWGGDTIYVNTSATAETGIGELLDAILLQAEILELTANPNRPAVGVVVEAQLDRGRGPVATVLVREGSLRRGEAVVVGTCSGRVRAMVDDAGMQFTVAGPSAAVEITGLDDVPEAGDALNVVESGEAAREVAAHRADSKRAQGQVQSPGLSLDDLMKRIEGAQVLELRIVLKADVQGSVEALRAALLKLSTEEVKISMVYGGVGAIKESDIMLAAASRGLVLGFGVRPDAKSRQVAEREGVEIRHYNVIYEAVDEVRRAMEGLLTPESKEKVVGRAEVRELFKVSRVGTVGGCRVVEGRALRAARVRVLRDSVQIYEGTVASLRHFKNDVREVEHGQECGVGVEGYNDLKLGDSIEFFQVEEIARTLSAPLATAGRRASTSQEAHP